MSDESRRSARARDPRGRLSDAEVPVPRPLIGALPAALDESDRWPEATRSAFLEGLAELGSATAAARRVGIPRQSFYVLRARDAEFRRAWDAALWLGLQGLLDEARRRAAEGVVEPVYQKGVRALDYAYDGDGRRIPDPDDPTGWKTVPAGVRRYSDPLLIQLLKAYLPEFRERVDLTHAGEVRTPSELDLSKLSLDELRELRRLTAKARREAGDGAVDVTPEEGAAPS